ncbi:NAD(P)/FAD-dependent oxidoreductase [bacterium]|nr:NAD(P)/FAD-dependent oxidoreductase [bacterium]
MDTEIAIIGAGPAGSTCAWKLKQAGKEVIILDKSEFPRQKLCAGWITPKVIKNLQIDLKTYPHDLTSFTRFIFHVYGLRIHVKVHQYSIRRYEFDHWLLERAGVQFYPHKVQNIRKEGDTYIIDDAFRCKYLVGAGGTHCPVYKTFFSNFNPRAKNSKIVSLEEEFPYDSPEKDCHLWFFENKLPGYAWFVPKGNGYLNVGIGGKFEGLKSRGESIRDHWVSFIRKLAELGMVKDHKFDPRGCAYYLRQDVKRFRLDNAFIIGDSAGLATRDMGEGIGPAVESGILAAAAIINGSEYSTKSINKYSVFDILKSGF